MPMWKFASPYDGYTSNWRAECGRSACSVRREGRSPILFPYPYVRPWAHINSKVEVPAMRTCDRMKLKVTALAKGKVESNRK